MKQLSCLLTFANAQVCCGGVDANEVDELLWSPGFVRDFIWQEILDVDGIRGGYNLQFAWSSGMIAGRCAAGSAEKQEMKTEPEKWEKTAGAKKEKHGKKKKYREEKRKKHK